MAEAITGAPFVDGIAGVNGHLTFVPDGPVSGGYVFSANGDMGFDDADNGTGTFKADGTFIAKSNNTYPSSDWGNLVFSVAAASDGAQFAVYTGSDVAYQVWAFKANGTNTTPTRNEGNNKLLTFADPNPDLQYFQQGDVVQSTLDWNQSQYWSTNSSANRAVDNPAYGFDGDESTFTASGTMSPGDWIQFDFDSPLTVNTSLEMYLQYPAQTEVKINGVVKTFDASTNRVTLQDVPNQVSSIRTTSTANNYTAGFSAVYADGATLVDTGVAKPTPDTLVVSTDIASNTMVVDGGKWASYDDSQVWSSGTTTGVIASDSAWQNAFDGIGEAGDAFILIPWSVLFLVMVLQVLLSPRLLRLQYQM